ncbi:MAG: hypothetical protein HZB85_09355 [Deltaproteobacteria bacterium]|nr:hypothetical protein [Deltaproteobacteria bacterium]
MRKLLYCPIIHMSADLGSLTHEVTKRGTAGLGEDLWKRHQKTIRGFWQAMEAYFDSTPASGFKVYQDGMAADGEMGQKIIEEGVKNGSKNFEIVSSLIKRGAVLVRTEDFNLLKLELDRLIKISKAKTVIKKLAAYLEYILTKNSLLRRRDEFIARRINETLEDGETGVLFVGAYHDVARWLASDISVKEVKDRKRVADYQRRFTLWERKRKEVEELSCYLVSPVDLPRA